MRFACLQLNPAIGKVSQNIAKANKIIETTLAKLDKPFDFLILPELALTGYNFASRTAIEPYLEKRNEGETSKWAQEVSKKNKCFTLVGYPEWDEKEKKIFNSAILTGPDGSMIYNYRKTFLYETDEVWGCSENPAKDKFQLFQLNLNKEYYLNQESHISKDLDVVACNIGICMDLNPYKFEAPFNSFEFSLSCYHNMTKLILCPMAWLSPDSPSIAKDLPLLSLLLANPSVKALIEQAADVQYNLKYAKDAPQPTDKHAAQLPEMSTVNYWLLRFFPFLNHPNVEIPRYYNKVSLVCCNRSGQEDDVLYGGSSLIFQFNLAAKPSLPTGVDNTSVEYFGSLGQAEEGIIVRDLEL